MRRVSWLALACLIAAAGCSASKDHAGSPKTLTERERDSLIARSRLPGAQTVGRAIAVSDRQAARAADMDSLLH